MARRTNDDRLYLRGRVWWCWGYDSDGKRWHESTHQRDKRAAIAAREALDKKHAVPGHRAAHAVTLEQALELVVQHDKRAGNSDETTLFHVNKGRHLLRVLGRDCRIDSLSLADMNAYMDRRIEERAHRHSIQKEIRVAVQALTCAKEAGLYQGDPAAVRPKAVKKRSGYYTPRERWLNGEQLQALIDNISTGAQTRINRKHHVAAYALTGLRESELYLIHPEHVDLEAGTVWIEGTKTDAAARAVYLSPAAAEVFRVKLAKARPGEPIFEPWPSGLRDIKAACKRAKVPETSFNDLRRSFCSIMATQGVPMQHCAKLMGHTSLDMVSQVYGRLAPQSLHDAVARLPALTVTTSVTAQRHETAPGAPGEQTREAKTA
jgi:integrase